MSPKRFWVWVFNEIQGLRWVLRHKQMAFSAQAAARAAKIRPGNRAILFVSRSAFHNRATCEARLQGVVQVTSPTHHREVRIAGRSFSLRVTIEPETLLEEGTGPLVRPLARK